MRYFPILAFFDESNVVSAAKADDLKKKYPALADDIVVLAEADPSPTKKYLEWAVGQLREGVHAEELVAAIQAYDKVLNRLKVEDKNFSRFKTVAEMQEATERASTVETRGDAKKRSRKGGVVLYGDKNGDRWQLVRPTTMDGAIYWGSNTSSFVLSVLSVLSVLESCEQSIAMPHAPDSEPTDRKRTGMDELTVDSAVRHADGITAFSTAFPHSVELAEEARTCR